MLRFTLLLIAFTLLLNAKDDVYLGAGPYVQTLPYKDADSVVLATPVVFFDNALFYIRWTRLGMYFYGEKSETQSWGLSFTAQPQILGYYEERAMTQLGHRNPTPILQGMPAHESGWEGGLSAAYIRGGFFAEALLLQDITGQSNGTKLRLETGWELTRGDWSFYPSLLAIWLSQPFAQYYFGVDPTSANPAIGRSAYRCDAALNLSAQTYIKYNVNTHWHLLANLRVDRFADTINESPLTGTPYMYSGMLSLMYSFNLFGEERAVLNPPEQP